MQDYFKEFLEHKKTCPHCSTHPYTCILGHKLLLNSAGWKPKNDYIVEEKEETKEETRTFCRCNCND